QMVYIFSPVVRVRPYPQTSLNGQLYKKTTVKILYSQRSETTSYSESVFDQWRTSIVLTRQLTDRLSANGSAFYGQGKYKSRGTQDDYLGTNGGLAYEISEHFKIAANYTYTMQHSKPSSNDYNKTVASLRAVFNF
ncbi:MAG: outer membrane beta-barrel protein, partial [Candidatus Omnitrophota bacterium]